MPVPTKLLHAAQGCSRCGLRISQRAARSLICRATVLRSRATASSLDASSSHRCSTALRATSSAFRGSSRAGRKSNRDGMRLATESPNPVSDFMCGQYSCVGDVTKGERNDIHSRVLAGSTLQHYSIWLTVQRKLTSCQLYMYSAHCSRR